MPKVEGWKLFFTRDVSGCVLSTAPPISRTPGGSAGFRSSSIIATLPGPPRGLRPKMGTTIECRLVPVQRGK